MLYETLKSGETIDTVDPGIAKRQLRVQKTCDKCLKAAETLRDNIHELSPDMETMNSIYMLCGQLAHAKQMIDSQMPTTPAVTRRKRGPTAGKITGKLTASVQETTKPKRKYTRRAKPVPAPDLSA